MYFQNGSYGALQSTLVLPVDPRRCHAWDKPLMIRLSPDCIPKPVSCDEQFWDGSMTTMFIANSHTSFIL
jgi:hypothetical protein